MPAGKTDSDYDKVMLNGIGDKITVTFTGPKTVYLGIHDGVPSDNSGNIEVTFTKY